MAHRLPTGALTLLLVLAGGASAAPPTLATPGVLDPAGAPPDTPQILRYRGPVDAPDAMGGHRSDRVVVTLAAGATLSKRDDGWRATAADGRGVDAVATRLAAADASLRPAFLVPPASAELARRHRLDRMVVIEVPLGSDVRTLVRDLNAMPAIVDRAELEGIGGILGEVVIPNDANFPQQWGPHNTGQIVGGVPGTPGADIDLAAAWALHTGTDEITIAIIDTGVAGGHPDLAAKMVPGWNTVSNNASTGDSVIIPHGTHCAGIAAAAADNGIGIAGVSWGAKIMPIKVLNFLGGGTEVDVAAGIVWAADNGAHIASMSLGFPGLSSIVESAVNYAADAGVLLVAASGNTPGAPIAAPAAYPVVIAVGATNNQDGIASFTTTGPQMEVTAPGVDILSTWSSLFQPNTYQLQSGTSMACPHVAGLAALLWSIEPSRSAAEIRAILAETADDKGAPGWDPIFGHGRINARRAVEAMLKVDCLAADLDCNGMVDGADLAVLLAQWGTAGTADLNGDGIVDGADLGLLLAAWGSSR